MAKFTDSQKGEWEIHITAGDLKRIRKETGIDLRDALKEDGGELVKAMDDNDRFLDLMWALCGRQCQRPRDEFECLFDHDTVIAAIVAVWESVWDFTRGQKVATEVRAALLASKERAESVTAQFLQDATQRIRDGQTWSCSANDSQESPASTTEPSLSPN